jgi:hypothetical protein
MVFLFHLIFWLFIDAFKLVIAFLHFPVMLHFQNLIEANALFFELQQMLFELLGFPLP